MYQKQAADLHRISYKAKLATNHKAGFFLYMSVSVFVHVGLFTITKYTLR